MIVINIELWPYGDKKKRTTLAFGTIINDATGTEEHGNYDGQIVVKRNQKHKLYTGRVEKLSITRTVLLH